MRGTSNSTKTKETQGIKSAKTQPVVDVGILTIRDDEFRAVLKAFPDNPLIHKGRHREYTLRTADAGSGGQYKVAILRQIEQGNGEAQEAARDLIDDLQPSLLLVVGIAGGLPSDDFSLGDVVLSTRILDFSVEARVFEGDTTYNVGGGPISREIASSVANLSAREDELGDWWDGLPKKPPVTVSGSGKLYGPQDWQKKVKDSLKAHYGRQVPSRPPLFFAGVIASSDRLVKDPKLAIPWLKTARGISAVEMESAGAHRATRERTAMLSIRGLSDIICFKRHDAWTKYACASAAAFAAAYLKTRPVPVKSSQSSNDASSSEQTNEEDTNVREDGFEECFANLIELRHFPETLYVAPANSGTRKGIWAQLNQEGQARISNAWAVHENMLYSLVDPRESRLQDVIDLGALEQFDAREWAFSTDEKARRLFVQLLNGALRDDLGAQGVRYFKDQDVYAFLGWPDEPPRKLRYQNVHLRSTVTVVSHYERKTKEGEAKPYQRHGAFQGRFRFLGGKWYLEITPTYRFTFNGKDLDWYHKFLLSGIKRLEKNRAVLSQLLIWQSVLRAPSRRANYTQLLDFAPLTPFSFRAEVDEDTLTPLDPPPDLPGTDREVEE